MVEDNIDIIDKLKQEAIKRCTGRIREASKKREGCEKRIVYKKNEYGMTSVLRSRYGL
jgi:hypothetical protein